jgi:tetratricopeptide (TPR) repeat protein
MKITRIAVVCLSFVLSLVSQAANPADLVKQGRELNNKGQQDEAIALYQQALKANPKNYDAHLAMGIALDLKGDYAEARKHIAHAIKLANADQEPQALRSMGIAWAFASNGKEAEKYHRQVFDMRIAKLDYVGAAEIANEIARILLETGNVNNANAWYEKGHSTALRKTDLKPEEKDLWDFRWEHAQARIAARNGNAEAAQKHVAAAKAILDKRTNKEQEPFYPYLTGYVAFYAKDYKTALAELSKANQKDPFILALMAQAYEATGDKAKAQESWQKVLESNAHNPANAPARPLAQKALKTQEPPKK